MWTDPRFWLLALAVACAMEFWAMLLHGRLWHGVLWFAHRSHHAPRTGWFEGNDAFAVLHALLAMGLIIGGLEGLQGTAQWLSVAVGIGMSMFGMAYFTVHDGLIHGRLPVQFLSRWDWLRRVRNAHLVHHHRDAEPYGLFMGQWELQRALQRQKTSRNGEVRSVQPRRT
jgi:beta-carotene 3-hydroxylase